MQFRSTQLKEFKSRLTDTHVVVSVKTNDLPVVLVFEAEIDALDFINKARNYTVFFADEPGIDNPSATMYSPSSLNNWIIKSLTHKELTITQMGANIMTDDCESKKLVYLDEYLYVVGDK